MQVLHRVHPDLTVRGTILLQEFQMLKGSA